MLKPLRPRSASRVRPERDRQVALAAAVRAEGLADATKTVGQVLGEGTEVMKSLTGLDVGAILAGLAGGQLVEAELAKD